MVAKILLTGRHATNAVNANKYPARIGLLQGLHAITIFLPFLWALRLFDLLQFSLPLWLRWLAAFDYILVIALMIWQMRSLSVNIAASHPGRYLVTSGPYRYLRHPLYLTLVVMPLDMWLLTANWIFLVAFVPAGVASKLRADYEEELLIVEYGEEYVRYQRTTGQLLPKCR